MRKPKYNAFRDGRVYVVKPMCATCIYRPASLNTGAWVIANAKRTDNVVICHSTLGTRPKANALCAGFFATENTTPVALAKALDMVEYVKVEKKGR